MALQQQDSIQKMARNNSFFTVHVLKHRPERFEPPPTNYDRSHSQRPAATLTYPHDELKAENKKGGIKRTSSQISGIKIGPPFPIWRIDRNNQLRGYRHLFWSLEMFHHHLDNWTSLAEKWWTTYTRKLTAQWSAARSLTPVFPIML